MRNFCTNYTKSRRVYKKHYTRCIHVYSSNSEKANYIKEYRLISMGYCMANGLKTKRNTINGIGDGTLVKSQDLVNLRQELDHEQKAIAERFLDRDVKAGSEGIVLKARRNWIKNMIQRLDLILGGN